MCNDSTSYRRLVAWQCDLAGTRVAFERWVPGGMEVREGVTVHDPSMRRSARDDARRDPDCGLDGAVSIARLCRPSGHQGAHRQPVPLAPHLCRGDGTSRKFRFSLTRDRNKLGFMRSLKCEFASVVSQGRGSGDGRFSRRGVGDGPAKVQVTVFAWFVLVRVCSRVAIGQNWP
jgi:hypothetical protein